MLEFRLLGPVELFVEGEPQSLPAKPRALLTLLLLHRNEVVALDRIVEELWEGRPPDTAVKAAQIYVSQLRKLVGDRLESRAPGYRLRVEPHELDVYRFEQLVSESDASPDERALALLDEALALWRGPALADVADLAFARGEAARLEERRLEVMEMRLSGLVHVGRHTAAVAELEQLVHEHPLRESLCELLMLALYRSGRQAEALDVYRGLRERLDEELGLTPSPALRELELAILRQDPELAAPPKAARPAATAQAAAPRRNRWLLPAGLAGVAALGALVVALLVGGGSNDRQTTGSDGLRPFVVKLESFLDQSRTGRLAVVDLVARARACKLTAHQALGALDLVERNRQSVLNELAALNVPDEGAALAASNRLQRSIQASIAADFQYRAWLRDSGRCARGAPPTGAADAQATAAKRRFVTVFNPLARGFGERVWTEYQF